MSDKPRSHASTESVPHGIFPLQIRLLAESRLIYTKDHERNAINTLLIGATTAFVENFMANILDNLCLKSRSISKEDPIYRSFIVTVRAKIKKSSFSEYKQLIQSLTGKGFDKYCNQESWIAVETLFKFRNQILHGKTIRIEYYNTKLYPKLKCGVIAGMEEIQSYLNGKKLLPTDRKIETYDVVSNKVMHHFMSHCYHFVNECHNAINKEFATVPVFTLDRSLEHLESALDSIKDQ